MSKHALNPKAVSGYAKAGLKALKKYGVHHLSKSSADNLLECANKFHLKSQYTTASTRMTLGTICHSVIEAAVDALVPYSKDFDKLDGEKFARFIADYPDFRTATLAKMDLHAELVDAATKAVDALANSSKEVLFAEGADIKTFSTEIYSHIETLSKSLTKEHLGIVLNYPVIASEFPVVYVPEETDAGMPQIPYLGYIDILKLGPDGRFIVSDLKTTFSANQGIWQSKMTKFQLWLYAKSLIQLGLTDVMPNVDITRVTIDLGTRRKVKPTKYKVVVERGVLDNIENYDDKFDDIIAFAQRMIANDIEIFAHSQYGCASCDYRPVCDQAVVQDDWHIVQEGGEDDSSKS